MSQKPSEREWGLYMALAQVGLEMVVPTVIGLVLDYYLGTSPWLTVGLTVVGFVGGITHIVLLQRRFDEKPPDET